MTKYGFTIKREIVHTPYIHLTIKVLLIEEHYDGIYFDPLFEISWQTEDSRKDWYGGKIDLLRKAQGDLNYFKKAYNFISRLFKSGYITSPVNTLDTLFSMRGVLQYIYDDRVYPHYVLPENIQDHTLVSYCDDFSRYGQTSINCQVLAANESDAKGKIYGELANLDPKLHQQWVSAHMPVQKMYYTPLDPSDLQDPYSMC